MASSVTVPQVSRPAPATPAVAPASKSHAGLFIGVGVVLVVLLAAGVGGFLLWSKRGRAAPGRLAETKHDERSTCSAGRDESVTGSRSRRVRKGGVKRRDSPDRCPFGSGQQFLFHFVFNEDGYVYIFRPRWRY
jgi:hypothetical protein